MTEFLLQSDIDEITERLGAATDAFAGKTVLLTGGRGFLGRYFMEVFAHLNEHVLDRPVRLVSLDNLITAGPEGAEVPERPGVEFVNHDVIKPYDWKGRLDFVIHAAGMPPGGSADEASVQGAVRRSLELANERGCSSVAIPAVGAGIGGFSVRRCAEILVAEARTHLAGETTLEEVRFVLFGEAVYRVFEGVLDAAKVQAQMNALQARRGDSESPEGEEPKG